MGIERINRLWLPKNADIQATMCLCDLCKEAYEAGLEHVCMKENSYPATDSSDAEQMEARSCQK